MSSALIDTQLHTDSEIMLGGFRIWSTSAKRLESRLVRALAVNQQKLLLFANTNFVVQCQPLAEELNQDSVIIINDGIGMDIASWLVYRRRFPENLNGTDFIPLFLHHQRHQLRVFLFGSAPGIAERAGAELRNRYGVTLVGTSHGFVPPEQMPGLVERINISGANVLLVAMGNPLQERWLVQHRQQLTVPLLLGVGACLDFLAGDKPRAPALVRKLHLEWCYRLCLEPRRLLRRYTLDLWRFFQLCLRPKSAPGNL